MEHPKGDAPPQSGEDHHTHDADHGAPRNPRSTDACMHDVAAGKRPIAHSHAACNQDLPGAKRQMNARLADAVGDDEADSSDEMCRYLDSLAEEETSDEECEHAELQLRPPPSNQVNLQRFTDIFFLRILLVLSPSRPTKKSPMQKCHLPLICSSPSHTRDTFLPFCCATGGLVRSQQQS